MPNCRAAIGSAQESQDGEGFRRDPDDQHCLRLAEAAPDQPVGEVVGVALIEWLADAPAKEDDPNQVRQRDGEDQQRKQHRPAARVLRRIEVRQNCEHGQQVADKMTAGITEKGAGAGEIVGQKAEQCAEGQEGDQRDQILAIRRGDEGEMVSPNRP